MNRAIWQRRAADINRLHAEFCEQLLTTLAKAVEIGRLLTEQKDDLDYGQWIPWIKENLKFGHRQAQKYMCAWKNRKSLEANANPNSHFTLDNMPKLLAQSTDEKASPGLKALTPTSKRGLARLQYLYDNGEPELIEAFEGRQLSLAIAESLAHFEPDTQRKEVAKLVVGKDKVVVLPMTEELLLREQRAKQMKADAATVSGLNEFQRVFREGWLKLVRKFEREYEGAYGYGEMWRLAEAVIIRESAPEEIKIGEQKSHAK